MYPLDKKQSSTDLLSRLKTRKVLGVGASDSGDVYRSKVSQILGHAEQLAAPFVKSYWIWHYFCAILYTIQAFLAFLFPRQIYDITFQPLLPQNYDDSMKDTLISSIRYNPLASRFYGCGLLTLACMFWLALLWGLEKKLIRFCLILSSIFQISQIIILYTMYVSDSLRTKQSSIILPSFSSFLRMLYIFINAHFYYGINAVPKSKKIAISKAQSLEAQ